MDYGGVMVSYQSCPMGRKGRKGRKAKERRGNKRREGNTVVLVGIVCGMRKGGFVVQVLVVMVWHGDEHCQG